MRFKKIVMILICLVFIFMVSLHTEDKPVEVKSDKEVEILIQNAKMMCFFGKYQTAINLYRQVLGKNHPRKAWIHYQIACCYFQLKQYDKAIEAIDKAIEKEPQGSMFYNAKLIFFILSKNEKRFLEWCDVILEKFKGDETVETNICFRKGQFYVVMDNFKKANSFFTRLITRYENHAELYISISEVYYIKARDLYQRIKGAEDQKRIAKQYLSATEQALSFLKQGFKKVNDPSLYGNALILQINIIYVTQKYLGLENISDLVNQYLVMVNGAIAAFPEISRFYYLKADIYLYMGSYKEALVWIDQGLKYDKDEKNRKRILNLRKKVQKECEKDRNFFLKEVPKEDEK